MTVDVPEAVNNDTTNHRHHAHCLDVAEDLLENHRIHSKHDKNDFNHSGGRCMHVLLFHWLVEPQTDIKYMPVYTTPQCLGTISWLSYAMGLIFSFVIPIGWVDDLFSLKRPIDKARKHSQCGCRFCD